MDNHYKKLFNDGLSAPDWLHESILLNIQRIKRRKLFLARMASGFLAVISLASLVPAATYAYSDLIRSGFIQYFSLLFTDAGIVLSSRSEYILSLAESLPSLSISLLIITILSLLFSLRLLVKSVPVARLRII